jgi:hypothetical protein
VISRDGEDTSYAVFVAEDFIRQCLTNLFSEGSISDNELKLLTDLFKLDTGRLAFASQLKMLKEEV